MKTISKNQNKRTQNVQSSKDRKLSTKTKSIRLGEILDLTITAIGTKNLGLAELANGYSVFVPKAGLEDRIKARVLKVSNSPSKFVIAELVETIQNGQKQVPVQVGEILEFQITSAGPRGAGIVQLPGGYSIIVPNTRPNQKVKVEISRVKSKYAFAKISEPERNERLNSYLSLENPIQVGSRYNVYLPTKANKKSPLNHLMIQLNGQIVFVKLGLGAKLGDRVQLQIIRVEPQFAVAKIVKLSPPSRLTKQMKIRNQIRQMFKNGVHFGEKAIKCNANMKKYVWLRKKRSKSK